MVQPSVTVSGKVVPFFRAVGLFRPSYTTIIRLNEIYPCHISIYDCLNEVHLCLKIVLIHPPFCYNTFSEFWALIFQGFFFANLKNPPFFYIFFHKSTWQTTPKMWRFAPWSIRDIPPGIAGYILLKWRRFYVTRLFTGFTFPLSGLLYF